MSKSISHLRANHTASPAGFTSHAKSLGAIRVRNGRRARLRTDSPQSPSPFGDSLLRYGFYPAVILVAILLCAIRPVAEPDCWFHMALGRWVFTHGSLPATDQFSFTGQGHEWISTGWGASVIQHYLYEKFNCAGLAYMVFALTLASYLAIYFVAIKHYKNQGSITLLLLAGILASSLRFSPRPELWSHLGMTTVLLLLLTAEDSPRTRAGGTARRLWVLPLLFALWANLHGGFFVGFIPLGVYGAWKLFQWRKERNKAHLVAIVPCVLSLFSWMLNPYGARILILLGQVKDSPTIKTHIIEWRSLLNLQPPFLPWPAYLGVALLIALAAWVLAKNGRRLPGWQLAILALFFFLEFKARRHVALTSLVAAAMLAPHLGKLDAFAARRRALLPSITLAGLVCLGAMKNSNALGLGNGLLVTGCETTVLPAIATEYLRKNPPPDNLFNSYGAGGYLMYFLGPQQKVFIDGRFYVYDPQVWEDFIATQDGEMSVEEVSKRYAIKTFLVYTRDNPLAANHLARRLSEKPDWKLVYFSDSHAIFVHDSPETRSYLESREFNYVSPFAPERLEKALANPETQAAAQRELSRALEISMNSASAIALAALGELRSGNPAHARQLFATAASRDPQSVAVQLLGKVF